VFHGYGQFMTQGLALGIDAGSAQPIAAIERIANSLARQPLPSLGPLPVKAGASFQPRPALAGIPAQQFAPRAEFAPTRGSRGDAAPGAAPAGDTFKIGPIYQQPGESAEALARRVADLIGRQKADRNRGAYRDA
jgi:hypothetical protein